MDECFMFHTDFKSHTDYTDLHRLCESLRPRYLRDVCKLQAALLGADSAVVATDALSRRRRSRQAASLFAMQPIL